MKRSTKFEADALVSESMADQAFRLMEMLISDQQALRSVCDTYAESDVFWERLQELESDVMIMKMCKADFR